MIFFFLKKSSIERELNYVLRRMKKRAITARKKSAIITVTLQYLYFFGDQGQMVGPKFAWLITSNENIPDQKFTMVTCFVKITVRSLVCETLLVYRKESIFSPLKEPIIIGTTPLAIVSQICIINSPYYFVNYILPRYLTNIPAPTLVRLQEIIQIIFLVLTRPCHL